LRRLGRWLLLDHPDPHHPDLLLRRELGRLRVRLWLQQRLRLQ